MTDIAAGAELDGAPSPSGPPKGLDRIRARFHRGDARQAATSTELSNNVIVRASDLIQGAGTGREYREGTHTRPRTEDITAKKEIPEAVVVQLENFMYDHLRDLIEVSDKRVLEGPGHEPERQLVQQLSDGGVPNEIKIKDFVRSGKGMAIAIQQMELRTMAETLALGLDLQAAYGRGNQGTPAEGILNVDRLAREFRGGRMGLRTASRMADRRAGLVGAIGGGALGGALGTSTGAISEVGGISAIADVMRRAARFDFISGGVVGAIGGGVAGRMLGRRWLTENGDIDMTACGDALTAMKNLPDQERGYLKHVLGIDVDDFQVGPGGPNDIQFTPGRTPETEDIFELQANIRRRLDARQDFYRALGAPRPDTRTVPFQLLTHFNEDFEAQTRTRWDRRIRELYNPNDPAVAGATPEYRLQLYMQARQRALAESVQDYIDLVVGGPEQSKAISTLESGKTRLEGEKGKWEAARDKKITEYGEDKTRIESTLTALDAHHTARLALEAEEAKFRIQFHGDADIDAAVTRRADLLDPNKDTSFPAQLTQADQWLNDRLAQLADPEYLASLPPLAVVVNKQVQQIPQQTSELVKEANEHHANLTSRIKGRMQEAQAELNDLSTMQTAISEKRTALQTQDRAVATTLETSQNDLDFFVNTGVLTEDQLATMTVDQLMDRMNVVHRTTGGILGWPADHNSDTLKRTRLINAAVEARVRSADIGVEFVSRSGRREREFNFMEARLSESELRTLSTAEINRRMNLENQRSTRQGWPEAENDNNVLRIDAAREVANVRLEMRRTVLNRLMRELDTNIGAQEDLKNHFAEGNLGKQVDAVIDMASRQGQILADTNELMIDRVRQMVNGAQLAAGDADIVNYSNNEQNIHAPRGYYEMMNLLFNYRDKEDGNERFQMLQGVLSPDKLAGLIGRSGVLGPFVPANPTADVIFAALATGVDNGLIQPRQLRQALRFTMGQLVTEYSAAVKS